MATRDWMTDSPVTAGPEESLREAFVRLCRHKVENLPVTREGQVLGVLNGGRLVQRLLGRNGQPCPEGLLDETVAAHMAPVPVLTPDTPVEEALGSMEESGWRTLPVAEEGRLVGVVSEEDFFGVLLERILGRLWRRPSGKAPRRLDVLLDVTREASAARDLPEIMASVGRLTGPLAPVDRALLLLPAEADALELRSAFPQAPAWKRIPVAGTPAGRAWAGQDSVRVDDAEREYPNDPDGGAMPARVALPLVYRGKARGVLEFGCRRIGAYLPRDLDMLELVAGHVSAAVNTAQRLEVEQRLVEELREAHRVKDEFLGLVTHDLKNALLVMMANSHLLSRPGVDPESMARMAQAMAEQTRYMSSLVNDVHDLARLGARALRLELADLEAGNLVRRVAEDHLERARAAGLELRAPEPEPVSLRGDKVRLRQVLENLVNNAVKYNRPGGFVEVRCRREGEQAVLEVEDSGIGIPPEEQDALFQMSSRLPGSAGTEGSGLGLYIARQIVELHGGTMEVESAPGRGSTFRLRLPLAPAAAPVTRGP